MKRFLSIATLFFGLLSLQAQPSDTWNEYVLSDSSVHKLQLEGGFYFGSNAMSAGMAADYYLHRYITNDRKDEVSQRLKPNNRFGAAFQGGITYQYRPDSSRYHYLFTIQHHYFIESRFNRDVFELYFRGNKPFAGQTIATGPTDLRSLLYYQAGIGVAFDDAAKKNHYYFMGSLLLGHDLLDIRSRSGSLYTAADGSYLDADLNITYRSSDTAAYQRGAVNGTGFGITAGFSHSINSSSRLHVSVRNAGIIHFFPRSIAADIDTSLRFQGVDATELFDFSDSIQSLTVNDSTLLTPYITDRRQESTNCITPGQFDIWFEKDLQAGFTLSAGVRQWLTRFALPFVWVQAGKTLGSCHTVLLQTGYGGYAGWCASLAYRYTRKTWEFQLAADPVNGFLIPGSTTQGAFVSLSKSF